MQCHSQTGDRKGPDVGTIILGSSGKLGGILRRHSNRNGLGWVSQRSRPTWPLVERPETSAPWPKGGTIINMAGLTSGTDGDLQTANVQYVQKLLEQAASAGIAHVILASSAAVYGHGTGQPLPETTGLAPLTPYGRSKAQMEEIAIKFSARQSAPKITILRIGNVAGSDALTKSATQAINANRPLVLHQFGNGVTPIRSYLGPQDLARSTEALVPPPDDSVRFLNIARPDPIAFEDLLLAYRSTTHPGLRWTLADAPDDTPARVVLDTTELQKVIRFGETTDSASEMAHQVQLDVEP